MKKRIICIVIIFIISILICNICFISSEAAGLQDIFCPGVSEPFYNVGNQWGLAKIKIEEAWQIHPGSRKVKVGIIDSGIDGTHPDLYEIVDRELSKSFLDEDELNEGIYNREDLYRSDRIEGWDDPLYDSNGHGTHVAGILAADAYNDYGMVGAILNVTLISLKAADINGEFDPVDIVEAINYAETIGIDIINYSAGTGKYDDNLYKAIKNFSGLFVCSAGNDRSNNDIISHYPSGYDLTNIMSVGATDENDNLWINTDYKSLGSNYGKNSVDLFSPGAEILSAYPKHICNGNFKNDSLKNEHDKSHIEVGFHTMSGTSMATPYVTAVAALFLSTNLSMSPILLKNTILRNVDKVDKLEKYCKSGGRLNAYNVLMQSFHHHSFPFKYYNNHTHIGTCTCGLTDGNKEEHYVLKSVLEKNPIFATCLGCKTQLDFRKDYANGIYPFSNGSKTTTNGSYIMPNGIIVLADDDMEAFLKGDLRFNNFDNV